MSAPASTPHVSSAVTPDEIDRFWRRTVDRARQTPLGMKIEELPEKLPYRKFRLTYRSLDGVPVRAYLGVPWEKQPRRLPVIVDGPGYSGWGFTVDLSDCQRGYLVLQVYPRGQGESATLWKVAPNAECAWINHGRNDPE